MNGKEGDITNKYVFNKDKPAPFRYIHPLKLEKVQKLLSQEIPDFVEKIYLFGSSLNLTCRPDSDIDIYFITKEGNRDEIDILHPFCRNMGNYFDLLFDNNENFILQATQANTLERNILFEEGLCLYEKRD